MSHGTERCPTPKTFRKKPGTVWCCWKCNALWYVAVERDVYGCWKRWKRVKEDKKK